MPPQQAVLDLGFSDPVLDSQAVFRSLLTAVSGPGSIVPLTMSPEAPGRLGRTLAAVCLSLLDYDTPLWLHESLRFAEVESYLKFHCGCPLTENPAKASFAVIAKGSEMPSLQMFNPGTPEYPNLSTTLIIQVENMEPKGGVTLSGPGIENMSRLKVDGLPRNFWREFSAQKNNYPLGVDAFLVADGLVTGLPRSVNVARV